MEKPAGRDRKVALPDSKIKKLAKKIKAGKFSVKKVASSNLPLDMLAQPDNITCGATCLQSLYRYYGDEVELQQIVKEVHAFEGGGGTLAVCLACHALKRGYQATIYTYDIRMFDPTWFFPKRADLKEKLSEQMKAKKDSKLSIATDAYLEFLDLGGKVKYEDLTRNLLRYFLDKNIPILTGLNANYLYRCTRDIWETNVPDDVKGDPCGHFVVLYGYEKLRKQISIADPEQFNPYASQKYAVPIDRVICSILLGILTYDANFLIIRPKS